MRSRDESSILIFFQVLCKTPLESLHVRWNHCTTAGEGNPADQLSPLASILRGSNPLLQGWRGSEVRHHISMQHLPDSGESRCGVQEGGVRRQLCRMQISSTDSAWLEGGVNDGRLESKSRRSFLDTHTHTETRAHPIGGGVI